MIIEVAQGGSDNGKVEIIHWVYETNIKHINLIKSIRVCVGCGGILLCGRIYGWRFWWGFVINKAFDDDHWKYGDFIEKRKIWDDKKERERTKKEKKKWERKIRKKFDRNEKKKIRENLGDTRKLYTCYWDRGKDQSNKFS